MRPLPPRPPPWGPFLPVVVVVVVIVAAMKKKVLLFAIVTVASLVDSKIDPL